MRGGSYARRRWRRAREREREGKITDLDETWRADCMSEIEIHLISLHHLQSALKASIDDENACVKREDAHIAAEAQGRGFNDEQMHGGGGAGGDERDDGDADQARNALTALYIYTYIIYMFSYKAWRECPEPYCSLFFGGLLLGVACFFNACRLLEAALKASLDTPQPAMDDEVMLHLSLSYIHVLQVSL
jgi:hypothetical protein